ncbi:serine/threonine protein kinase [Parabacteroides sp. OttesenSCG-928-K15]|nr:serine/threonine protein kinase [Parabacteroides sp. OttesenSCG-928-K15]
MNLPYGHLLQNGKYHLTHVVGQGGFGITYKGVWNTEVKGSLGTVETAVPIAIKEYFFKDYCYRDPETNEVKVHSETGNNLFHKFKEKLIKEARILSDVHHPNIVNVLEVFEENNTAYIAMEYISGLSLKEMMEREGIMPEEKVLRYIHQIGEALQFVHDKNILHLDIKPSNILVDRNGNARLIDFGVSKRYDTEQQETSTTMLTLSKGFASIEQYDNEGTQVFSPYPDIYSLGASLYNLLTGKIPLESILRATRPFVKPTEVNPAITAKTESVILKAMEIVPADRYPTVKDMMDALDKPPKEEPTPVDSKKGTTVIGSAEGDTTLLYQSTGNNLPKEDDPDEQTILNAPPQEEKKAKRKKGKVVMPLLLSVVAVVVLIVVYLFYFQKDSQASATENPPLIAEQVNENSPVAVEEEKEDTTIPVETGVTENESVTKEDNSTVEPVTNSRQSASEEEKKKTEDKQETESVTANLTPETSTEEEQISPLTSEELNATITALLASAYKKESEADYEGAQDDFKKAYALSSKDEHYNLSVEAGNKAKEKKIIERKAQYEIYMPIGKGNLTVALKLSTGKVGAIDEEGIERIPCKYLVADFHEEGKAFQREDNMYDIYDETGKKIHEGVIL